MLEVLKYAGYILSVILAIVTALVSIFSKRSSTKKLKTASELADKIREFMQDAEKMPNYTAGEKLNYVTTRLIDYCYKNKISYDECGAIALIEKEIALSKNVNVKEQTNGKDASNGTATAGPNVLE